MNTTLIHKEPAAEGTMLFRFAKPEGFAHEAGKTVDLTLIAPPETDAEGNMRTFSIASAPHEPDIAIAARMRDTAFKRSLASMEPGTEAMIEGPYGSFLLHENTARPAVFLAGGIGITPFRSMISDAAERGLPHSMHLFYANRRPEDAAFLGELSKFGKLNPRFAFIPTMTGADVEASAWSGERGRVDAAMLARYLPQDAAPVYYLAGPQGMVLAMRTMLKESGVSGDDIRIEEFAGY